MQMYLFRTIYKSCVKKKKLERMQSCFRNFTKKKSHSGKGTEMWSKSGVKKKQGVTNQTKSLDWTKGENQKPEEQAKSINHGINLSITKAWL